MKTILTILLTLTMFSVMGQTKKDSCIFCIASTSSINYLTIQTVHPDTIETITYCLNIETLEPKWLKVKAVTGTWNFPQVNFNGLIIYYQYLNVPNNYKPVYSIK